MKDKYININGEIYQKVQSGCPLCGAYGLHNCSGNREIKPIEPLTNIQPKEQPCLWDSMPETFPGSGIKIGGLVCHCPKCSWRC